jgi:hypothetical protein
VTMRRLAIVVAVTLGLGCSAAFAATMSVGTWHLWAGSQTLTKSQCTVSGATDTYSDELHPTVNNSAATTLAVQPDANKRQWIYLQFDLTACNIPTSGGADSATLTLFELTAPKSASRTLTLAPVQSTWPANLPFATALALTYGTSTASFATGTTNNVAVPITVTADVDSFIKGPSTTFGWRISDGSAATTFDQSVFNSSEAAANKPQLVINYEK